MIVHVNGTPVDVPAGATVSSVVEGFTGEPDRRGVAVAVDAEVVPRGEWDERTLQDGARLEVVAAVQGG